MYRVCLTKDGNLIEMQGGGKVVRLSRENEAFKIDDDYTKYNADCDALEGMRLNTLLQNALNSGYTADQIQVRWVTDDEWATIQAAIPKPINNVGAVANIQNSILMRKLKRMVK